MKGGGSLESTTAKTKTESQAGIFPTKWIVPPSEVVESGGGGLKPRSQPQQVKNTSIKVVATKFIVGG